MTVLDASAVLALIHDEPGADLVASGLNSACLGAANLAEVIGKLVDADLEVSRVRRIARRLGRHDRAADRSRRRVGLGNAVPGRRTPVVLRRSLLPGPGGAQHAGRGADRRSALVPARSAHPGPLAAVKGLNAVTIAECN